MQRSTRIGNRLLAALPPADFDLLAPHLKKVSLERDAVLVRSGDPTEQIYFPRSGTIAFIMEMPNGQTVATAVVGNEGAVGMLTSLGPSPSPTTAVVRVTGTAWQISPAQFRAELRHSGAIRRASGEIADILRDACSTNAKSAADYAAKVIEISNANTNSALDFLTHLMGTRSLSEAIQLSATHGRKNFEATSAHNRELWELAQKVTTETAEPLKKSLTKALQAAS